MLHVFSMSAGWRYRVTVQMIGSSSIYVSIKIALYNSSDFFDRHTIYSGSIIDGRKYSAFLDSVLPSPIIKVTFTWKNLIPLPLAITPLGAESVTLTHGNDGAQYVSRLLLHLAGSGVSHALQESILVTSHGLKCVSSCTIWTLYKYRENKVPIP